MPGNDRPSVYRPPPRRWAGYLVAHSCKSLIWHCSGLLFAFFLTETCGLTPRAMGTVIAVSLFVNAGADAAIGVGWHRRFRQAVELGRMQVWGGVLASLFFIAFCALPFLRGAAGLPMATGLLVAFRLSFALLDVPQNAMVPVLATDPAQRMRLLALRNVCSGLASLFVALVVAPILLVGPGGALRHLGWAVAFGCAVTMSAIAFARSLRSAGHGPGVAVDRARERGVPICWLLVLAGPLAAASTLFRSLEPYGAAYAGMGVGILIWASIGAILSQPLWVVASGRLAPASGAALAGCCALTGAAALAGPLHTHPVGPLLGGFGFGIGSGGLWLMLWAGTVRRDAMRRTACLTAMSKIAQGIAALFLGQALHDAPYRITMPDMVSMPRLLMIGALVVVAACCLFLAIAQWRVSRTTRDAGSTARHPAARPVRNPLRSPRAASATCARRAVPAD